MIENVLYRFYDDKACLLYVGITNNPLGRFSQHHRTAPWWQKAAAITLERFATRQELVAAEIKAIQNENPKYNRSYNSRQPDVMRISTRTQEVSPDANRFGNVLPSQREPMRSPRLKAAFPCPVCRSPSVYKDATETAKPADELVRCPDCLNIWLDDEWRAANSLVIDNQRDMSHAGPR